jgi:hypothetical protein
MKEKALMLSRRKSNLWDSLLPGKDIKNVSKNTESNAERIVMFQRNLAASERNHVTGVLSIKIKSIRIDSGALSTLESYARQSLYCTIQVRNFTTRTKIARNTQGGHVEFHQTKHFPVNVVRNRSHPFNLVRLEVVGCGSNINGIPLGGVLFHIHDLIRGSPASGEFPLSGVNLVVGSIQLELTFNYGILGYGISQQLACEDRCTEDAIQYSLLPRINPDPIACEPHDIILKTQAVPHPEFIPFERKVFLSYGKDLEDQLEELGSKLEDRHCFKETINVTKKVRETYFSISDRANRLLYLNQWLQESHCRKETVPDAPTEFQSEDFPKKAYMGYLNPIIPKEPEFEMPKFLELLEGKGKGKGKDEPKSPGANVAIKQSAIIVDSPFRPSNHDENLWTRIKTWFY